MGTFVLLGVVIPPILSILMYILGSSYLFGKSLLYTSYKHLICMQTSVRPPDGGSDSLQQIAPLSLVCIHYDRINATLDIISLGLKVPMQSASSPVDSSEP